MIKKAKSRAKPGQADWRSGQAKYNALDSLALPMPESKARHRMCRKCDEHTEDKSYWYCSLHNVLSLTDDDNLIYSTSGMNLEAY